MFFYLNLIKNSHILSKCTKFSQNFGANRNYSNYFCNTIYKNPGRLKLHVNKHTVTKIRFSSNNVKNNSIVKKIKKSDLKRLLNLAQPEKWKIIGAVLLLFISSGVTMAVPFSLGKILDLIYAAKGENQESSIHLNTREKLNNICLFLIGIFTLGAICNFGRIYLMSTSGYRMTQSLRMQVFSSIIRQELGWFDRRATGELINRLSNDTQLVGNALSQNISDGLRSICMVFAGTTMMLYTSPELALVGFTLVPPVAFLAVSYGRFVRKITRNVQDDLARATTVAQEKISNIRTVKTFGKELAEMEKYKEKLQNVLILGYKESLARGTFFAFNGFAGNAIVVGVLYYGGVMVSDQTITLGNLSAFLMYAAYIGVSVSGLTSFYSELNKSLGAASRLWELIDRTPVIPILGGKHPEELPTGRIVFDDVSFSYPAREETNIFSNLTLDIKPGMTLAVVGPSGSGKSTMGALLLRLYEPKQGKILLDGTDIKELDPSWLRKNIGTVSQEPVLFSGTIKDNILYGAEDPSQISEKELVEAATEANIYEFCQDLPDKFDTIVGERGVMLSGGQKQRIAIARALIKNPKILLLDEATSALDAHSEYLVREALQKAKKGRTVLTIAHRLSTIRSADQIAVLDDGKIVQIGSYETLLTQDGQFKDLVNKQTFKEIT